MEIREVFFQEISKSPTLNFTGNIYRQVKGYAFQPILAQLSPQQPIDGDCDCAVSRVYKSYAADAVMKRVGTLVNLPLAIYTSGKNERQIYDSMLIRTATRTMLTKTTCSSAHDKYNKFLLSIFCRMETSNAF